MLFSTYITCNLIAFADEEVDDVPADEARSNDEYFGHREERGGSCITEGRLNSEQLKEEPTGDLLNGTEAYMFMRLHY